MPKDQASLPGGPVDRWLACTTMDYDVADIAERYHDARKLPEAIQSRWLQEAVRSASDSADGLVVDIGCGTGRFLAGLSEAFGSETVGVDSSRKMLSQARRRGLGHRLCVARAESLPFRPDSLRLAFMSNVAHHMRSIGSVARELRILLAPGGSAVVRNYVREDQPSLSYLSFFPEALSWSQRRLPTALDIEQAFVEAGFVVVRNQVVEQPVAGSLEQYLSKIELRAYSDLAAIPDAAFAGGLARMREAVLGGWAPSLVEPLRLLSFRRS